MTQLMCIASVFSIVIPLPSCLLHTSAFGLSYWQYQQTVRNKPTATCQQLLNVDCLATAFCFLARFGQAVCYFKFANYVSPLLTSSYTNKIKKEISATKRVEFYALVGFGYQL